MTDYEDTQNVLFQKMVTLWRSGVLICAITGKKYGCAVTQCTFSQVTTKTKQKMS